MPASPNLASRLQSSEGGLGDIPARAMALLATGVVLALVSTDHRGRTLQEGGEVLPCWSAGFPSSSRA